MEEAPVGPTEKPVFVIEAQDKPFCPECGSIKLYRDGLRVLADGSTVQRYLCRDCSYRFSWPRIKKHHESQILKTNEGYNKKRRVGAPGFGPGTAKNLAGALTALTETDGKTTSGLNAGATEETAQQNIRGLIINFLLQLQRDGRSEATVKTYNNSLNRLVKANADLNDPESVKEVLAKMKAPNTTKSLTAAAYTAFLRWRKQTWEPPKIQVSRKIPLIPTEQELDTLICACGRKTAAALQTAKETGLRIGEILRLKWSDIDFERRLIVLNDPEKGGESRIFKVSPRLLDMLNALPRKNERIFNVTRSNLFSCLYLTRKRLAVKLQNPRFKEISFHTFRHWRATTLYHQTKDILLVKETLGHRKLDTSLLYIQLEKALYNLDSDEFYSATAKTTSEAAKLIETGFEYVCTTPEGIMLFRKRK